MSPANPFIVGSKVQRSRSRGIKIVPAWVQWVFTPFWMLASSSYTLCPTNKSEHRILAANCLHCYPSTIFGEATFTVHINLKQAAALGLMSSVSRVLPVSSTLLNKCSYTFLRIIQPKILYHHFTRFPETFSQSGFWLLAQRCHKYHKYYPKVLKYKY